MPSSSVLPPITERFVLKELAGAGGMGTVYRALETSTGQTVAIKLLQAAPTPRMSSGSLARPSCSANSAIPGSSSTSRTA